jgi:hypothetical protein
MVNAALGFSLHTGWAVAVAVVGWASAPRVVDRRRFILVESQEHDARFAYHAAAELDAVAAARHVAKVREVAQRRAEKELKQLLLDLEAAGFLVRAAGLPPAKGLLGTLSEILRSHAAIHAAEGELFRAALAEACASRDLHVIEAALKERYQRWTRATGMRADAVKSLLRELGRPLGAPWALDQKDAALAALIAGVGGAPH